MFASQIHLREKTVSERRSVAIIARLNNVVTRPARIQPTQIRMNNTALFYYYYSNHKPVASHVSRHASASGSGERRPLPNDTCRSRRALRVLLSITAPLAKPFPAPTPNQPGQGKHPPLSA